MSENIRRARRSIGLGLTFITFAVVLCALIGAQVIAAMAAGLLGTAPLMVMVLQTIGGIALLLTFESGASVGTDTALARRNTILRICAVAAMATTFVVGRDLTFGYGVALALGGGTLTWFWDSVPAEHGISRRRLGVALMTGLGVLLLSGVWERIPGIEDAGSAIVCALCLGSFLYVSGRKARAGHRGVLPVFCWMALTVLVVPAFTASDPTWTTLLLAGFALVTGLLWVCLTLFLVRLRNARPEPSTSAVVRYAPVYAPVLATVVELFGMAPWVTPLDLAAIVLVCLAALVAGRAAHPTGR